MTTSKHLLEGFSQGNRVRSRIIEKYLERMDELTRSDNEDTSLWAAHGIADICLSDSRIEQNEIANLIAVVNSENFDASVRDEAARRVAIMLELS